MGTVLGAAGFMSNQYRNELLSPSSVFRLFILLIFLLSSFNISASADEKVQSVQDLRYGVMLYEYYQRHYHSALTELAIAEKRGGIQGHGDHPKLVEGGIKLIYGMEESASSIFESLLEDDHPVESRNTAWFYLAKLQYHRGEYIKALESLEKIEATYDRLLSRQVLVLRANIAIRVFDSAQADVLIGEMGDTLTAYYAKYNLGAALAREGECLAAIPYFASIYNVDEIQPIRRNKEYLALYDKALTNAGYCYILIDQPSRAVQLFSKIRLEQGFDDQALLGLGWANSESEQYQAALQPWLYLQKQDRINQYVLEAMLAVPYAYEAIEENGLALASYQQAETVFNREIDVIDGTIPEIEALDLVSIVRESGRESAYVGWLDQTYDGNGQRLDTELSFFPESQKNLVLDLLVQNQFQDAMQSLVSLGQMERDIEQWQSTMQLFEDLLAARSEARESQVATINERDFPGNLSQLSDQLQSLTSELNRIDTEQDFFAVAGEELLEHLSRLEKAEENYDFLTSVDQSNSDQQERLKRYRGVLLWQASENFSDNFWQHKKSAIELEKSLKTYSDNLVRLETATSEAPDILPFEARINQLNDRIAQQASDIDELKSAVESVLKGQMIASLQKQREKLLNYRAESRLAQARLYDQQREASY